MSGTVIQYHEPDVQLGIVVPVFNEIDCVPLLAERLKSALRDFEGRWQVWLVDDGSVDGTSQCVKRIASNDHRFQWIRLARNFGQPAAIEAGLREAAGDCVVLMDGDLQDPPELIPEMLAAHRDGAEVVIAQRRQRAERGMRGLALRWFHRVFRFLADADIESDTGTFCLLDRCAVDAINRLPESHRFFPGLRNWIGFTRAVVQYDRPERSAGSPKQSFRRLAKYAADAVFSYSFKPLRMVTLTGVLICTISFLFAAYFAIKRLTGLEDASIGFTTLTCAVLGLGGFQLIAIGILGEYVGRIYEEVKRRPTHIVSDRSARRVTHENEHQRRAG